jgi:hypothetical protein
MRQHVLSLFVIVAQSAAIQLTAWSVPIANLYNTGLDNVGNYLAAGNPDGNYTVLAGSPLGAFTPVAIDDTQFPFPPWVVNNPTFSRWIGTTFQSSSGPGGTYTYRTTINLPANANLSTVMISGVWSSDDPATILVNTLPSGQVTAGHTTLVPFMLTNNFQVGPNNIDFVVQNAFGPTGLRVDRISGKYAIPEPASFLLAALGAGGMFMRRINR